MTKKLRAEAKIDRSTITLNVAMGPNSTVMGKPKMPNRGMVVLSIRLMPTGAFSQSLTNGLWPCRRTHGRLGQEPDLLGDVVAPRCLDRVPDAVGPGAPVGQDRQGQIDDGHAGGHVPPAGCRPAGVPGAVFRRLLRQHGSSVTHEGWSDDRAGAVCIAGQGSSRDLRHRGQRSGSPHRHRSPTGPVSQ